LSRAEFGNAALGFIGLVSSFTPVPSINSVSRRDLLQRVAAARRHGEGGKQALAITSIYPLIVVRKNNTIITWIMTIL
jgi:hypothetical protein